MSLLLSQLGGGGGTAWTQNLSDTVTLSDATSKGIGIAKSDTVTLSEAISKGIGLNKSDSVTLSESIFKSSSLFKSDTLTLSEAIIKATGLSKSDSVTLSESIIKALNKPISDSVTLSENLTGARGLLLSLSDTITLSEDIVKAIGKSTQDTVTLSEAIAKSLGLSKSDTIVLSEVLTKAIGIVKADDVALSEFISKGVNTLVQDSVTLSDIATPVSSGSPIANNDENYLLLHEDMSHKAVRLLISDTIKSIDDSALFVYARASDFNSKGKRSDKRIHLDLLKQSIEFSDNGTSNYSKTFKIAIVFYKLDKTQGAEEETTDILDEMDELSDNFINKLNLFSIEGGDDNEINSDNVEIGTISKEPVVKVTTDCATGFVVQFNLTIPDTFDYCSLYD